MVWNKVTEEADLGFIDPQTVRQILQHECQIGVVEVLSVLQKFMLDISSRNLE